MFYLGFTQIGVVNSVLIENCTLFPSGPSGLCLSADGTGTFEADEGVDGTL